MNRGQNRHRAPRLVPGGADIDDATYDAAGRLIAIDANNDRLVLMLGPTSSLTLADLPGTPSYVASDPSGDVYVTTTGNGGNQGNSVLRIDASGTVSSYLDFDNDVNTGTGNAGACEPGNGNGAEPMGLAVFPVLRGSVRLTPNAPPSGAHVTVAHASGTPSTTYTFGGGDVCAARDGLRTAFGAALFAGLAALRGPCTTQGTDYGDVELLADYSVFPGATDVLNSSGNANVVVDSPIDLQPTLFIAGRSRYIHAMDASATPAGAPSCYRTRFDFGSGEVRSVAAAYEGDPASLVVYGADRTSGAIKRMVAATGAAQTLATVNSPRDLVMLPSGCLLVAEENANRVVLIDPNEASCSPLPCDTHTLVSGFSDVRGLSIDAKDVAAEWTPWLPSAVSLEARRPGAAGNALALSSSAPAVALVAFAGGTDGAAGAKAVATLTVAGAVTDGVTVTVGTHTYELDLGASGVVPGHIPVALSANDSATVAAALGQAIRETEARVLITDRTAAAVVEIGPTLEDTSDCF